MALVILQAISVFQYQSILVYYVQCLFEETILKYDSEKMDQDIENILQVAHQDDQPGQF